MSGLLHLVGPQRCELQRDAGVVGDRCLVLTGVGVLRDDLAVVGGVFDAGGQADVSLESGQPDLSLNELDGVELLFPVLEASTTAAGVDLFQPRSEEPRVGKECFSQCRYRGSK